MAKNQKSLRIILRQNKNENNKGYSKWYAELMDILTPKIYFPMQNVKSANISS